jgi:hypothetical protein
MQIIKYKQTKAERREAKNKPKMAVSGRNTKRLAQNLARRRDGRHS